MTKILVSILAFLAMGPLAYGYEGPSPLRNIQVDLSCSYNSSTGLYSYTYKVTNPPPNNGEIHAIRISLKKNPQSEAEVSADGLTHCRHHSDAVAQRNLAKTPMVPVGSVAPDGWSCDYQPQGNFSFASVYSRNRIKPGTSMDGYILKSYAPPGIRGIIVEPTIELDLLPDSYSENVEKLSALENSVAWTGNTIGPKAPPKVLVPIDFIDYLISMKEQSLSLGWIKEKGIADSLDVKLNDAKKKIAAGDTKTAKNILGTFQKEVQAQNGKQLTPEAYALLYFNAKYLIDHL